MSLTVSPKRVAQTTAVIALVLMAAHLIRGVFAQVAGRPGFAQIFQLDTEGNVPTWFSASLLLACSLALVLVARTEVGRPWQRHWLGLALISLLMSLDESAELHERLNRPLNSALSPPSVVSRRTWVVVGLVAVIVVALVYRRFIHDLPNRTRRLFLAAAALYVGGAAGVEVVGGVLQRRYASSSIAYQLSVLAEEGLEMFGVILFLYAICAYLAGPDDAVTLTVQR